MEIKKNKQRICKNNRS